jgi:hypothetical protein
VHLGEISGSHGGEYEDGCLFWVVAPFSVVEVYQRFRGASASIIRPILVMEAADTFETSVNGATFRKTAMFTDAAMRT